MILTVLFIACLLLTGCNHDDEPIMDYYVRYTAIAKPNADVRMSFSTEPGKSKLIQASMPDGKFQYSIGPVNKGFKADLVVSYEVGGPVEFLSIEVALRSEPFVLKRSGRRGAGCILSELATTGTRSQQSLDTLPLCAFARDFRASES